MLATLLLFPFLKFLVFAEPLQLNTTDLLNSSLNLNSQAQCFDRIPPGQQSYPATFSDCLYTLPEIIGNRDPMQSYTFARHPVYSLYYYHLPFILKYQTCLIYLNMVNDGDEDTVPVGIVESAASVLAYRCAGGQGLDYDHGGRMTVGPPGRDLIRISIYGRMWPR
ncbi:hypothetical protein MMC28_004251 [Mycoblastus sanguinarius]|nr:hypothetical protein [Mycoblastus sanguinarius]